MAEIQPLRGLRFGPRLAPKLANLLCPPYDVIAPAQASALRRHRYNIIHLELPRGGYAQAANRLSRWWEQGVMVRDAVPSLYLHQHRFIYGGKEWVRRGLVAAVGLQKAVVKPHEGTLPHPKQDRLNLLRATRTQISPIFTLYDDPRGQISNLLSSIEASPPLMEAALNGEAHRLWALQEEKAADQLRSLFHPLPLFIADGHHRFETALAYREERGGTGGKAHHYTMMTLVATSDPGLLILPVHRLVRGIPQERLRGLGERLRAYFEVEDLPLDRASPEAMLAPRPRERVIGMVGLKPGRLWRLALKPGPAPALDVQVLHQLVLGEEGEITYTPFSTEVMERLGEFQLGFLLTPVSVEGIKRAALAGERLPGKSTYFYPKLPTGLVLFPVEGEL